MTRGYSAPDVRRRIIEALARSDAGGASGIKISRMLNMSRTTATKYLNALYADGTLRQRDMGNVTLWSLEPGQESYTFPDDYFKIASAYAECIRNASEECALSLVHNCVRSGGSAARLILEAIVPASDTIHEMYAAGRIGAAEQSLLHRIIYRSLSALEPGGTRPDPEKGAIVVAADSRSEPMSRAASAAYRSGGWSVYELGDISSTAGVLFDLDFQRLVDRVWDGERGILLTVAFSNTAEGLNFLADSIYPITKKSRRMRLLLCGVHLEGAEAVPPSGIRSCDHYVDGDMSKILQLSDTAASGGNADSLRIL